MRVTILIAVTAIASSCTASAKQKIDSDLQFASIGARRGVENTTKIDENLKLAIDTGGVNSDASQLIGHSITLNSENASLFSGISKKASSARSSLHNVEDKVNPWVTIALRASFVLLVLAILALLWKTGLGLVIRKSVSWIAAMIPNAQLDERAKADAQLIAHFEEQNQHKPEPVVRRIEAEKRSARYKKQLEKNLKAENID